MPAPGEPRLNRAGPSRLHDRPRSVFPAREEGRDRHLNSSNDLGTPPSAGLLLSVAFITVEACGAQCDVEVRLHLEEVWIESEVRVGRESVEHDSGGVSLRVDRLRTDQYDRLALVPQGIQGVEQYPSRRTGPARSRLGELSTQFVPSHVSTLLPG